MKTKHTHLTIWSIAIVLLTTGIGYAELSDGLMAYYPFNGNTVDETGNYSPLTVHGATPTADRFGNSNSAYSFDGIDNYIAGSSYDIVNPSDQSSYAIAFWFKPTTTWTVDTPSLTLISNHDSSLADWRLDVSPLGFGGKMLFEVMDTSPMTLPTTTDPWTAGTWYSMVVNYDASSMTNSIWVNGIFENSIVKTDDIGRDNGDVFDIGRYATNYIDMTFDELRLYNRALSADEIGELNVIPAPAALVLGGIGLGCSSIGLSSINWLRRRRTL